MTNQHKTTLYVGVTNNLERRVSEHKQRIDKDCFTYQFNLNKLVWHENFSRMKDAILREKQIKRWNRKKKLVIIEKMNPEWKDLMDYLPEK